jgi:hypothetical protein
MTHTDRPSPARQDDSFFEGAVFARQLLLALPLVFLVMDVDVLAPDYPASGNPLDGITFVIGPPLLLLVVFMLGFPIRLDPAPREFWTEATRVTVFGILASVGLLVVAWIFGHSLSYETNGHSHHDYIPNDVISGIGIFGLAFFLMNARFPFITGITEPERPSPTPP